MTDICLWAENEEAMIAALPATWRYVDDDGNERWRSVASGVGCLRRVDPITVTPAILDDEGNVITPAEIAPGYHMNCLCTAEAQALIDPSVILDPQPETPANVMM